MFGKALRGPWRANRSKNIAKLKQRTKNTSWQIWVYKLYIPKYTVYNTMLFITTGGHDLSEMWQNTSRQMVQNMVQNGPNSAKKNPRLFKFYRLFFVLWHNKNIVPINICIYKLWNKNQPRELFRIQLFQAGHLQTWCFQTMCFQCS